MARRLSHDEESALVDALVPTVTEMFPSARVEAGALLHRLTVLMAIGELTEPERLALAERLGVVAAT